MLLSAALFAATASATPTVTPEAAQRALADAVDALSPSQGPRTFSAGPESASREATGALRDLAVALPVLHGADRRRAQDLLARPTDKNDLQRVLLHPLDRQGEEPAGFTELPQRDPRLGEPQPQRRER
jgi:hypothetical protein